MAKGKFQSGVGLRGCGFRMASVRCSLHQSEQERGSRTDRNRIHAERGATTDPAFTGRKGNPSEREIQDQGEIRLLVWWEPS
jgi:hypothetical protein